MAMSFNKLKAAGLPRTSAKLSRMAKLKKVPSLLNVKTRIPKDKFKKPFNFSKFTKAVKIKSPKVTAMKRVIKRYKK